jgi:intraflagellar transport protein 140
MVFKSNVNALLLKEIAFRAGRAAIDISNLAKMAVAGDQSALDIFSSWRPRTTTHCPRTVTTDNITFYCAAKSGNLFIRYNL